MPANPTILSALNDHVFNKTGKRVLDTTDGGNPPTGGDKDKAKTPAPDRIPMFDPNDPKSRINYVQLAAKKYGLPHGYGDVFTRFNEVPDTQTDTLTSRQIAQKHAAASGLPAPLLYSSAMVEGMSGLYPYGKNNDVDWSGNEKFPVHGFKNFGLDTFSDAYPGLVKKGYLPSDFNKQFIPAPNTNEKGQKVNSAYFTTADAALQAKAAMIRDAQDNVVAYAAKNKIPLTDKAKQFLTLAYYNGGPGAFMGMVKEAQAAGGLANDAYFNTKPSKSMYGQVWNNVNQRFQLANALTGEGYQFQDTPPVTTPPVTTK